MQPISYPVQPEILEQIWHAFMKTGQLETPGGFVPDPVVILSWVRCKNRLDPWAKPRPTVSKAQTLASILEAHAELISIAIPYIEDIHQFIEGSDSAILLADGTACILTTTGDKSAMNTLNELGLGRGAYWSEGQVGTNALALVLSNAMPVQVVGAEHYFQAYHHLTSTAAPIYDVTGHILGLVAIISPAGTATSHTLSLVMAAARAIGNQLQTNLYLEEANRRLAEVNTILGAIDEGVMVWDAGGKITHINPQAAEMLHLTPATVLGKPLGDVLNWPAVLAEAVQENRELRDIEVSFDHNEQAISLLTSLCPIFEGDLRPIGYIALLRRMEQVRELVHQQVGSQATLTLEDLQAESPAMRRVLRQAAIAARGTAPVLLRGEGGVGKNHLGRAIHNASNRADKPFIALNCRAIPHELMISEFLGYDPGATSKGRPSKFELAHEGTLMLDQIDCLSLEMQSALLHVIETGHIMRLQSTRLIPVDVRIIVATAANLEQLVTEGSFIRQLYYAFGVFNFYIPPLRERVEDIPLLAERFLARVTQNYELGSWVDQEALTTLYRYPWPGNVRELENVLERALNHSKDGTIRVIDLPEVVRHGRVIKSTSPVPQPVISTAEAEREAIIQAGWACQGRVSKMAQQLGIGRTTLWRKLKQLNISPEQFKR